MKELKHYPELDNMKTIKKITDLIKIVNINGQKYILKKIEIPLNKKELLRQHEYINYLKDKGFNTPKIKGLYKIGKDYLEIQEYILGDTHFETKELIKLLATFHNISKKYNKNLKKRKKFKFNYKCRGANLDYILLGFKEKYHQYPLKNFQKNCSYITKDNLEIVNNFLKLYKETYQKFTTNYSIKSCLIHNDINSLNTLKKDKELYLIDFDLGIKSTEYVDFVDACLKRYDDIAEIDHHFAKFMNNINQNILIYNKYNPTFTLDEKGVYEMIIIKLFAFYFFVMLRKENATIFNKNISCIYNICGQLNMASNNEEVKYD